MGSLKKRRGVTENLYVPDTILTAAQIEYGGVFTDYSEYIYTYPYNFGPIGTFTFIDFTSFMETFSTTQDSVIIGTDRAYNDGFGTDGLMKMRLITTTADIEDLEAALYTAVPGVTETTLSKNAYGYKYAFDITDIFNSMATSDYRTVECYLAGESSYIFYLKDFQINIGNGADIVNIDDKNDNVYLLENAVVIVSSPNSTSKDATVTQYKNIEDDVFLYGDDTDWIFSGYTDDFHNIGYFEPVEGLGIAINDVSGNLTGTYSYLATYKYEDEYEGNPNDSNLVTVNAAIATYNYNNIVFFGKHEGHKYFIKDNSDDTYTMFKTNTENIVQKSALLNSGSLIFTIKKAVFEGDYLYMLIYSGNDYRRIWRFSLDSLSIDKDVNVYLNPNAFPYNSPNTDGDEDITIASSNVWLLMRFLNPALGVNQHRIDAYSYDLGLNNRSSRWFSGSYSSELYKEYKIANNGIEPYYYLNYLDTTFTITNRTGATATASINLTSNIQSITLANIPIFYNYTNQIAVNLSTPNAYTIENSFLVNAGDANYAYGITPAGTTEKWYDSQLQTEVSSNTTYSISGNILNVSEQQMTITNIPISNSSRVTGRNLYRQRNTEGYYLLASIADNTTTTFNDNISDTQISAVSLEYDNDVPPDAIDSAYNVARQFYLTSTGRVYYSKPGKAESVPLLNYFNVNTVENDSPKRIVEFFGGLVIFFDKSIWYVDLSSSSPVFWVPRELNVDFGCKYPFSIVKGKLPKQAVGLFYFASDKSVRVLNGSGKQEVQLFDNIYTDSISKPIEDELKSIADDPEDIYMAYYDYKLYLSIPSLKRVYVWDSRVNAWTKFQYPTKYKYIGKVDDELLAGRYNDSTLDQLEVDDKDTDNGTAITWNYKSKVFADNYEIFKDFTKFWVRGSQDGEGEYLDVDFNCNNDDFMVTTTANVTVSGNAVVNTNVIRMASAYGRDVQIEISGSANVQIDRMTIKAVPRQE